MNKILLDDIRNLEECFDITKNNIYKTNDWLIVRNYDEFFEQINKLNELPIIISFDHDLADEHYTPKEYWDDYEKSKKYQESQIYKEKTGYDVLKDFLNYLDENNIKNEQIKKMTFLFHTMNPVGFDNMNNYYKNWLKSRNLKL